MISRRPDRLGRSKWIERSNRPGRSRAGSRSSARLVAPMMRTLAAVERRFDSCRWSGSQLLSRSTTKPCSFSIFVGWSNDCSWMSSSLTMPAMPSLACERETVVAGATPAPPSRHAHAGPRGGDGVDLLDESDGATLGAGRLAQFLEVGPDLPVRLAVVHRLEGRRRDVEERHAGFLGQRLGHVGLAGAGRAFEEDAPPGRATHRLPERLVAQEQVEGADDLLEDDVHPPHVVEADLDLRRAEPHVRRPARRQQRHQQHDGEEPDQDDLGQHHVEPGRAGAACRGAPGRRSAPATTATRPAARRRPATAACAAAGSVPASGHIGVSPSDDAGLPESGDFSHWLPFLPHDRAFG